MKNLLLSKDTQIISSDMGILTPEQLSFMEQIGYSQEDSTVPVYLVSDEGKIHFLNCGIAPEKNRFFEKNAPKGLYRGGAVIQIATCHGGLVVPDERYSHFKPCCGLAAFPEGSDLRLCAERELVEEFFIYNKKEALRFVPSGIQIENIPLENALDIDINEYKQSGNFICNGYVLNEENKGFEILIEWDIRGLGDDISSVIYQEDWFSGGKSGIPVFVIGPDEQLVGLFSGQQGFIRFMEFGIHKSMNILSVTEMEKKT